MHFAYVVQIPDQLLDANPKSWIKKFRKNSLLYLLQMTALYHLMSLGLMYVGNFAVTHMIADYQTPTFPVSVAMTITSGPIEEILFFGLAYHLAGTPQAVLVTGTIWSLAHVFNTQIFQMNTLGYVNFLITIPHLFFSLRMWLSSKGWLAIIIHSSWNLAILLYHCSVGLRECTFLGHGDYLTIDVAAFVLAGSLISILVLLHKKDRITKTQFKILMSASIVTFAVSEVLINLKYVQLILLI